MFSRERYFSERIARLAYRIPRMSFSRSGEIYDFLTRRDLKRLDKLENQVMQKINSLTSSRHSGRVNGYRGSIIGSYETLIGDRGERYDCIATTDQERIEIEIRDIPKDENNPIRKYRIFWGKFGGEIADLSGLGDQRYSWRRNSADHDYPEKPLSIKESCKFMQEILDAKPESLSSSHTPSQPSPTINYLLKE